MRNILTFGLIGLAVIIVSSLAFAQGESITITTYYPAPYGVYRDFEARRNLTVGEEGTTSDPVISTTTLYGDVVILPQNQNIWSGLEAGNLGVGTSTPGAKLHVNGDIRLQSGATINNISTDTSLGSGSGSDSVVPTQKAVKAYVLAASGGGGCYVSYTGNCSAIPGFSKKGNAGVWGICVPRPGLTLPRYSIYPYPAGGWCYSSWYSPVGIATAVVCCQ